ncbi:MAG: hypothetical protein AABP62_03050 [Planctomycetota bacterium]
MLFRATLCIVVSSLGFGIVGCGGDSGPKLAGVTGTVTYGGKPLAGATVTMQTEGVKGQASLGSTDSSGKFKMTTGGRAGVPVGKARVGISKAADTTGGAAKTDMKPEDMMKLQKAAGGTTKKQEPPKPAIPEKYADPTKSGLTADVGANESKNVFEFPLVD